MTLKYFLLSYLRQRPLLLTLMRAEEAFLYQKYLPLKPPILDIGCGDGFFAKIAFSKKLKTKGIIIDIGIDVKDSRIKEASKLGIYKKLVIYNGRKIPYPESYFSTIISNCVLEHVAHLNNMADEIYRVLKPGGVFLTTVMAKPWEEYLFGSLILGNWYKNWMRKKQVHLNLFSRKEWDEVFKKSSFQIKEKVGYLDKNASRLIDISHYLSLPSLLTHTLFGKWVVLPGLLCKFYLGGHLATITAKDTNPDQSGAIFYCLTKP